MDANFSDTIEEFHIPHIAESKPSELGLMSIKELAGIAKEIGMKAVRKKLGLD